VLLLASLAAQAALVPPLPKRAVDATASVRIERPSIGSSKDWARLPREAKRQVIVHDGQDGPMLLRLVENQ
jgi:hypothetical protein